MAMDGWKSWPTEGLMECKKMNGVENVDGANLYKRESREQVGPAFFK